MLSFFYGYVSGSSLRARKAFSRYPCLDIILAVWVIKSKVTCKSVTTILKINIFKLKINIWKYKIIDSTILTLSL